MRIVIGEVSEKDGTYKMLRAVHMDMPEDATIAEAEDALKQALAQLLEWRKKMATVGELNYLPPSTIPV